MEPHTKNLSTLLLVRCRRDAFAAQKAAFPARVDKARSGGHNEKASQSSTCARMAELADALASGASSLTGVEVRVLFRAPISPALNLERKKKDQGTSPVGPGNNRKTPRQAA